MSNYRPMPSPELRAAIQWLRTEVWHHGEDVERQHAYTLFNEIQELLRVYECWYAWERYQDFIRPRNELARELFVAMMPKEDPLEPIIVRASEPALTEIMKQCLKIADRFLELSGEKVKKAEEIKERLREVLGWKP